MWESSMAENRIIKLGKQTDFECHQMEHQIGLSTTLRELGVNESTDLKAVADSCGS